MASLSKDHFRSATITPLALHLFSLGRTHNFILLPWRISQQFTCEDPIVCMRSHCVRVYEIPLRVFVYESYPKCLPGRVAFLIHIYQGSGPIGLL